MLRIREHKDASPEERAIREVNPGVYAIRADFLRQALSRLSTDNAQGELYLTDVVEQAAGLGVSALSWPFADTQGVNDRAQLAQCESALRLRMANDLARSGVTVRDPATTYVELSVRVAPDVDRSSPTCTCAARTNIAAGAHIETGCVLSDVHVAERRAPQALHGRRPERDRRARRDRPVRAPAARQRDRSRLRTSATSSR